MDNVTAIGDRGAPGQGRGGANMKRGDAYRQGTAGTNGGTRHAIDAVEDVTSLLGMPDGDLPAPVQACIAALMDEVERLRNELAQVRRHEAMLRDLADHHPTLPVQHRRAFLRELTKLLAQAGRSGLGGTVLHLHIVGMRRCATRQVPRPPRRPGQGDRNPAQRNRAGRCTRLSRGGQFRLGVGTARRGRGAKQSASARPASDRDAVCGTAPGPRSP